MFTLRKYQTDAITKIHEEWEMGHKKTLLVLPTGTGKTIVFAKVVEDMVRDGSKALIIAHRGELLEQARDKIRSVTGLDSSLEKAESTCIGSTEKVVVASIQTLSQDKRLEQFPKNYFKTIIIDETHHIMSDTYQKVLKYFNDAYVLGVTATPDRADQKNLGKFFDSKAYEYSMMKAVSEGYLCPIKAQMIPLEVNIRNVGLSNGDYAVGELGSALEPYLNQIALEMVKYCKNRKTVIFLPLVKTSEKFSELLNLHGLRSVEVNGYSKDRAEILKDFEDGEYDCICNSMLLTEGWDCPAVDCVVCLRPTKIRSLYQQLIGRGMRLSPGKKDLLILDFLWMTERHDLCKPSSLISKDEDVAERINKMVENNASGVDLLDALETAESDVVKEREESLAKELASMKKKKQKLVDPIQYAFSISAEDLASYSPTFAWEMAPATPKQIEYLEKHGIYADDITNAGLASMLIEKLKNRQIEGLATPKQIRFLERYGFIHVGTWKFDDASKMITRFSINNWMIPRGVDPTSYRP